MAIQHDLNVPSFPYDALGGRIGNNEVVPRVGSERSRGALVEERRWRHARHGEDEGREGGCVLDRKVLAGSAVKRQQNVEGKG
jgi:hypothetical protein